MPRLTIDNQKVSVPDGATVLDAAVQLGIQIPTLCFLRGRQPCTTCFVCVVKVNGRENLVPSCATRAEEGMRVESQTPDVLAARRTALELLMSDHLGDCTAPCHSICPARMNIPAMIRRIIAGDFAAAAEIALESLVLPATLGHICPAPCEKGCRRAAKDAAVTIRQLHKLVGSHAHAEHPHPALRATLSLEGRGGMAPVATLARGKTVAIVGAGPAGLAAGFHLLRMGHPCTIFDDHDAAGGALRYCIDERALPREVLDAEVTAVLALGAVFRNGVRVGKDVSLAELCREFPAVIIATGEFKSELAQSLGLPAGAAGLSVDRVSMMTSRPGVFAAGDVLRKPQRMAVRSIGDGRVVAACVHQFLSGEAVVGLAKPYSCHIGPLKEGEIDRFMVEADAVPREDAAGLFTPPQALTQASRCLHCDCRKADNCRLRDACAELVAIPSKYRSERRIFEQDNSHPLLVYESGKCIDCGLCVQIAESAGVVGLAFIGRGFSVRVRPPFDAPLAKALGDIAADVIAACPTGALAWWKEGDGQKPGRWVCPNSLAAKKGPAKAHN